ncbi:hypothetical protein VE01_05087 [Pseudogymnoascus verrucosus]|uniref:Uncharacterized protein n=1 Tax=Pseudogymnoascus verrucosus TaxID=342668 RepID=A0A1B8GPV1_9PEZI|nr:uncharacterized protein VE01_05087 [Pseudogymnoascus verrucosus]OBT97848.1 hypothetical protein VE01_05087 [Pseudogymnoascus verrucosus]
MVCYQLRSWLHVVVGLLLLGQISFIQCSSQPPRRGGRLGSPGCPRQPHHVDPGPPPQPIGIEFGPEHVVAAYAHSPTNITILAMINGRNSSHAAYFENMMLLRLANDKRVIAMAKISRENFPVPTGKEIVLAVKNLLWHYLRNKLPAIPFFGGPKHGESDDGFDDELYYESDHESASWIWMPWIWMRSILSGVGDDIEDALIFALDKFMEVAGLITLNEVLRRKAKSLTDNAIRESFTPVIQELLDSALKNHNVTIDFALLSLPEYFPQKHEYIPINACFSLGVKSAHAIIPKPLAALESVATKPEARILLLDQGHHHMSVQVVHYRRSAPTPFDAFRGEALEKTLFARVTAKGALHDQFMLKDKFNIVRDGWKVHNEIERARILIKDNILDCVSKDRADEDCEEDRHHNEWPLDLKNWWTIIEDFGPSSIPTVVLEWEDVKASEDEYVERLSNSLENFLRASRKVRLDKENGGLSDFGPPQEVDTVVIVTDQPHGALLRRAAKLTVGDGVRIYGGRITDFSMAAEGAAILALKRRRRWDDLQEYEEGLTLDPPVCDVHV